jgi:hypothetical protein
MAFLISDYLYPDIKQGRNPNDYVPSYALQPNAIWNIWNDIELLSLNPAITGIGGSRVITPLGMGMAVSGTSTVNRYEFICPTAVSQIGSGEFTCLINVTIQGALNANSVIFGKIGSTNGTSEWGIRANGSAQATFIVYIGTSGYSTTIGTLTTLAIGRNYTIIGRRKGSALSIDTIDHGPESTFTDVVSWNKATTTATTGAVNTTALNILLGANATSSSTNVAETCYLAALWNRSLRDDELQTLMYGPSGPFGLWNPPIRRLVVVGGLPATALTATNSLQSNLSSSASIGQTNVLAGANNLQSNLSSTGTIIEQQTLTATGSLQNNLSSTGAITQTISLSAQGSLQSNLSSIGAVLQTIGLSAANNLQNNFSTSGQVTHPQAITGQDNLQNNLCTSGAFANVVNLTSANSTQNSLSSVGLINTAQTIAAQPSIQNNLSSTGAISKQQALAAVNSLQSNLSSSTSIVQNNILLALNSAQNNFCTSSAIQEIQFLVANSSIQNNLCTNGYILGPNGNWLPVNNNGDTWSNVSGNPPIWTPTSNPSDIWTGIN